MDLFEGVRGAVGGVQLDTVCEFIQQSEITKANDFSPYNLFYELESIVYFTDCKWWIKSEAEERGFFTPLEERIGKNKNRHSIINREKIRYSNVGKRNKSGISFAYLKFLVDGNGKFIHNKPPTAMKVKFKKFQFLVFRMV